VKPELQASIIQVQGPHRNITIAATYWPPRHNLKGQLLWLLLPNPQFVHHSRMWL
jgi:hypothetical protein